MLFVQHIILPPLYPVCILLVLTVLLTMFKLFQLFVLTSGRWIILPLSSRNRINILFP